MSLQHRSEFVRPDGPAVLATPLTDSPSHHAARILVVEDQPGLRDILVELLCREHYRADAAATLDEARTALALVAYELVVLDVMLPDGSGYDLLRSIKADPATAQVRVVVLSALNEMDDYMNGYSSGADDYVGKPFDFPELLHRVKRLC